jgi:predicted ABC-type ATPase
MKEIIIVAGPNGAGKTSFAKHFLFPEGEFTFLNADEIAHWLISQGHPSVGVDFAAARMMLQLMDSLTASDRNLMFETTLATRIYMRRIREWQKMGYSVALIYLRLSNVEAALERVAKRVAAGGHDIPKATIRQRFLRSHDYFETLYKPIVDEWYTWDSLDGDFKFRQAWDEQ